HQSAALSTDQLTLHAVPPPARNPGCWGRPPVAGGGWQGVGSTLKSAMGGASPSCHLRSSGAGSGLSHTTSRGTVGTSSLDARGTRWSSASRALARASATAPCRLADAPSWLVSSRGGNG